MGNSFSARLPELCDSINRKLGGPVIVLPPKPKQSKRPEPVKHDARVDALAKKPAATKPQRTLQRALSNEQQSRRSVSRGPGSMIALMRSATSTSILGLKREGSEPPTVKSVPKGEPGLPNDITLNTLSLSSSATSLDGTKAKKKALVEAELQDAISALRKPNRELAGKSIVEAAEKRATGTLSQIKSECLYHAFLILEQGLRCGQSQRSQLDTLSSKAFKSTLRQLTTDIGMLWLLN
jgi:DNA replication regulator SLD3